MIRLLPLIALTAALAACQDEVQVAKPAAMELTPEAAGFYCQMTVLEHDGPKAQIHLEGNPYPIWFTQVRDAVAFMRSPEESKDYVAVYVNDMAKAKSWTEPGSDNWVDAGNAWFVISSRQAGGMGAPETIPFGTKAEAEEFVRQHGGQAVQLDDIPTDYVLAPVDPTTAELQAEVPRS